MSERTVEDALAPADDKVMLTGTHTNSRTHTVPCEHGKPFKPSVEQSLGFAGCCRRNPEADPFREGYPSTDEVFTAYIVALGDEVLRLRGEGEARYTAFTKDIDSPELVTVSCSACNKPMRISKSNLAYYLDCGMQCQRHTEVLTSDGE